MFLFVDRYRSGVHTGHQVFLILLFEQNAKMQNLGWTGIRSM